MSMCVFADIGTNAVPVYPNFAILSFLIKSGSFYSKILIFLFGTNVVRTSYSKIPLSWFIDPFALYNPLIPDDYALYVC